MKFSSALIALPLAHSLSLDLKTARAASIDKNACEEDTEVMFKFTTYRGLLKYERRGTAVLRTEDGCNVRVLKDGKSLIKHYHWSTMTSFKRLNAHLKFDVKMNDKTHPEKSCNSVELSEGVKFISSEAKLCTFQSQGLNFQMQLDDITETNTVKQFFQAKRDTIIADFCKSTFELKGQVESTTYTFTDINGTCAIFIGSGLI